MSVKIKVSYEDKRELDGVLALLKPVIISWNLSRNRDGSYKKAYITLNFKKKG